MKHVLAGSALAALLVASGVAGAQTPETWMVTGSGSGAAPISDAHDETYGGGATGGVGLYRSLVPQLALGARVDAGALGRDNVTTADANDDTLGFGALNAALRLRPLARSSDPERGTGFYLEAAGGPGLRDDEVRPFIAPGAGYIFAIGDVGLGPTARYLHVFETGETPVVDDDVQIGTLGIELVLFDERGPDDDRPALERPIPEPVERFEPAARFEPDADRDGDGIIDRDDACVDQPETVNGVNDHDGCPDSSRLQMKDDRVVIDEKTFFDYDEATLRPEGERKLDEIVALHRAHGSDWKKLRVMGHADRRGPMPYNQDLSRRRASAVREYLIAQGVPGAVIDIEAYGETRPSVPNADTEREFQMNRRVEFQIVR